jgi:hypothetical protein
MKTFFLIFLSTFISVLGFAQSSISVESHAYPAGLIPGIRFDYSANDQVQVFLRGAYNATNRRSWGVQDNEKGGGFGFGIGAEFQNSSFEKLSLNVRADLWFMDIDYYNSAPLCPIVAPCFNGRIYGNTNVTVLQPTIGFGYQIPISNSFFLRPTINLGYEINIKTEGDDVGEGAILLGGIQIGYLFDAK